MTFAQTIYLYRTITLDNAVLSIGTLNDLDPFQTLTISASQSLLLFGGSAGYGGNSVSGTAGDLVYVADGGSLTFSGTGSLQLVYSGNINTAGAAQATISAVLAGGGGFSKTGTGTLTLTGANNYTGARPSRPACSTWAAPGRSASLVR